MKNYWKRFAAWGTGFGVRIPDILASFRLRVTAFYFLTSVVILLLGGYFIDRSLFNFLQAEIAKFSDSTSGAAGVSIADASLKIKSIFWLGRAGMAVVMGVTSYLLAGITLNPLRKAIEAQRRFVANASHELRTPLAIMKTNSDLALSGDITKEEAKEVIRSNSEEIQRMVEALQVLLTLSGYENRIDKLIFSSVDVVDVAARSIAFLRPYAASRKVRLTLSGNSPIRIHGNAAALEEMISNLTRNAISYTPPRGSVHVAVARQGEEAVLTVQDSGIGIPSKDISHIFEPFYRGSNVTEEKQKGRGVGLGLAIVHQIVKLHRATIEVQSDPNVGTTFIISFKSG